MPVFTPIDYANAYFPTPILPKIVGKPTYEKLRELKKHLKANAANVQSDLGGGAFGHLGLVLDDATYQALTNNQQYTRPPHPGPLAIQAGTAHHEAVRLREEHAENVRLFRETIDVERALKRQIISAIDKEYIKELYDDVTSTITMTIPQILTFLFTRYGEVTNQRVVTEEEKVKNFTWNIIDPPVVLFNLIEDLQTISDAANNPKTISQLINYGLEIIKNTGEFETALLAWIARPTVEHTWPNFKTHFTTAHTELSRIRGAQMRGSAFHQANATIEAIKSEMNTFKNNLVESINSLSGQLEETEEHHGHAYDDHAANATMSNQDALLTAIQALQTKVEALNTKVNDNNQTPPDRNSNSNNRRHRGRSNTSKYCWTHGACAHNGKDCTTKRDGHKVEATFTNKMGGSTAYCGQRNN